MDSHIAHSENRAGAKHALADHLRAAAETARVLAAKFDAAEVGYWAGWWHDLGKFHPDFAKYLQSPDGRRGPDHSSAGMVHAAGMLELLAFVIGGHHAGLDSGEGCRVRLKENQGP
jgi:CRISPR-associated endonuclease/helicase Cas3